MMYRHFNVLVESAVESAQVEKECVVSEVGEEVIARFGRA